MRKRLVALCLAAVLAVLVIVPVALANNGHRQMKGKHKFQLNGVVVSADAAAGTMVVKVKSGTWTVKKFRTMKLPLPLTVSPTARMTDATVDPAVPATLGLFVKDAKVHIGGTIDRANPDDPVFTATKLILQKLPAPVPAP